MTSAGAPATLRTLASIGDDILGRTPRVGATRLVAVDGGSAAGTTTFARRLAIVMGASVVHVDDVSWWESFFGWSSLLVEGVIEPLRPGRPVRYRPPAWDRRGRHGAIEVAQWPAVIIEGVGAGRRELAAYLDVVIWVDTDRQVAYDRGMARPGEDPDFWREWEVAEEAHLAVDRPWERADVLVSHDPPAPPDPERQARIVTAATWQRAQRPR